jgi:hypothetical protein
MQKRRNGPRRTRRVSNTSGRAVQDLTSSFDPRIGTQRLMPSEAHPIGSVRVGEAMNSPAIVPSAGLMRNSFAGVLS